MKWDFNRYQDGFCCADQLIRRFRPRGLRTPASHAEKQELLKTMAAFFTENPDLEIEVRGVTAARAATLHKALVSAGNATRALDTTVSELKEVRDAAASQLKRRMRGLINELKDLLPPLDGRWKSFGLNAPGAPSRPASAAAESVEVADSVVEETAALPGVEHTPSVGSNGNGSRESAPAGAAAELSR